MKALDEAKSSKDNKLLGKLNYDLEEIYQVQRDFTLARQKFATAYSTPLLALQRRGHRYGSDRQCPTFPPHLHPSTIRPTNMGSRQQLSTRLDPRNYSTKRNRKQVLRMKVVEGNKRYEVM